MDKILVMGCGTWGSALAKSLSENNYNVSMWHYNEQKLIELKTSRAHPNLLNFEFNKNIEFDFDLQRVLSKSNVIVLATPSKSIREIVSTIKPFLTENHILVNTSKGLETNTFLTMSEVISDVLGSEFNNIVSMYGPSHAEEVAANLPTALVSSSREIVIAKKVQKIFSSKNIRVYTNGDIKGVELGGSLKNIIAIATGVCDGLGFGDNTKSALITRGIAEITRLGIKMGAAPSTFSGLSGIGDLIATCLSKHSRNRFVGEELGSGKSLKNILDSMDMVAEGVITAKSVHELSIKYQVDMPISNAVYQILFEKMNPKTIVLNLMSRDLIQEKNN